MSQENYAQTIEVPMRGVETHYAYDLKEFSHNMGRRRIFDLIKMRRTQCMAGLAKHLEDAFWSKPADSTDKLKAFGLKYWLTADSSDTAGSFGGGNATGFSSGPGGLDSSTFTRWKNFTGAYTTASLSDLGRLLRRASMLTDFTSPVDHEDYSKGVGQRWRMYTNLDVILQLTEVLQGANENLGTDRGAYAIRSQAGAPACLRTPFTYAPALDSDAQDPIFCLDMNDFCAVFMKGWYMKETEPDKSAAAHNVVVTFVDNYFNYLMTNRRLHSYIVLSGS